MTDWTQILQDELSRIWDDVTDVSPEERELAEEVAKDAAKLGAKAVLGEADEGELEIVKATAAELSATAAIRANRVAKLAVSRVIDRLLTVGLGLL